MDKFMKIGAFALLSLLAVNVTSCKDNDPTIPEEVIPDAPEVPVVRIKTISGQVTNFGANATATLKGADGATVDSPATLAADGTFKFENLAAGTYTVVVTSDGKFPVTSEAMTINDNGNDQQHLKTTLTMLNLPKETKLEADPTTGISSAVTTVPTTVATLAGTASDDPGQTTPQPSPIKKPAEAAEATTDTEKAFETAVQATIDQLKEVADAAQVRINVTMPDDALDGETPGEAPAEISLLPVSNKANAEYLEEMTDGAARAVARAESEEHLELGGVVLRCNKSNVTLKKPITLEFDVDDSLTADDLSAEQWDAEQGKWIPVDKIVNKGKVTIAAAKFASYVLTLKAKIVSTASGSEPLNLAQTEWDNTHGAATMTVANIDYTYKMGTTLTSTIVKGNKVQAYLINALIERFGITAYLMKGSYPVDIELPVGTGMRASGVQYTTERNITFKNVAIKGVTYGTTALSVSTYSLKEHTGGSN